ncbi:MAG: 23S rRNA (adenine(2503)-C(2))-methyltransferase RlmN [Bacillota bacterium]
MNRLVRLKDKSLSELEQVCKAYGQPPYRAKQLWRWMYAAQARSFDSMTNLPAAFREQLSAGALLDACWIHERREDEGSGSVKYAMRLEDGLVVEAVALLYRFGLTACVSSQAGCRMGCQFCASGRSWARNLSSGEIVDQVLRISEDRSGQRVSRVVMMGTGEPLDNYEPVLKAIRQLHDPAGTGIGHRSITISTCGMVPEIRRLAREGLPVNLAVSLHAADDETRRRLMPGAAGRASIDQLVAACADYTKATGRRVTFEYVLVDGINDREMDARRLAGLVKAVQGHVNLIPLNPVEASGYRRSPPERVRAFVATLQGFGTAVTVRRELGTQVDGACGQLRQRWSGSEVDAGKRRQ